MNPHHQNSLEAGIHFSGSITEVELIMNNNEGCQKYPHLNMDEHCKATNETLLGRICKNSVVLEL